MSQQEIDRLWDAHSHECNHSPEWDYVMDKEHFAQATAEIRRQAFLEAADIVQHFIVAGNAALALREMAEKEKS